MSDKYKVIGHSVPRIDGPEKVTGAAKYTLDLKFPNMLYGKILTSPHAHARIISIDTSEAEALPGVKAVITHEHVPTLKYGLSPARWDENIFCSDKVRFVGDKVAAVACLDESTCYKALKLIKVEYEVLPAALNFLTAMDEGQPQIHDEYEQNINYGGYSAKYFLSRALAFLFFRENFFIKTISKAGRKQELTIILGSIKELT